MYNKPYLDSAKQTAHFFFNFHTIFPPYIFFYILQIQAMLQEFLLPDTPIIFHKKDRKNAVGITKTSPLNTDKIYAGKAFSMDVKKVVRIILYPTNGADIKYNFNPVTAIS